MLMLIFLLLALPTILRKYFANRNVKYKCTGPWVCVISKQHISKTKSHKQTKFETSPRHIARNDLDIHADTCCAGSNWRILEYMDQVCEVAPFLECYKPVNEIPVIKYCTIWTSPTGDEYLLIGNQLLWFGTQLPNSLINPNQFCAFGIDIQDNPFDTSQPLGINCDDTFIPFGTMGTIVYFESRVPMDWEIKHLPVIFLSDEEWDPSSDNVFPNNTTREDHEMRTIWSMTSSMTRWCIKTLKSEQSKARIDKFSEVEQELDKISPVFNAKTFCHWLIFTVQIATTLMSKRNGAGSRGTQAS